MKETYTDMEIIQALRNGGFARERAWEYAYKNWRSLVIGAIVARGGRPEEALEAFQEVAVSFEERVRKSDFKLQHKLSTYLVQCVYFRWLKMRKKAIESDYVELYDEQMTEFVESVEQNIIGEELASILDKSLSIIGERCKAIIVSFLNGFNMKEIAVQMNFKGGEQVAKNEKRKCINTYLEHLNAHPHILEYIRKMKDA